MLFLVGGEYVQRQFNGCPLNTSSFRFGAEVNLKLRTGITTGSSGCTSRKTLNSDLVPQGGDIGRLIQIVKEEISLMGERKTYRPTNKPPSPSRKEFAHHVLKPSDVGQNLDRSRFVFEQVLKVQFVLGNLISD